METKQTAVEWLVRQIVELEIKVDSNENEKVKLLFQQAKAMEKEQIESAFDSGYFNYEVLFYDNAEQYYNETYG